MLAENGLGLRMIVDAFAVSICCIVLQFYRTSKELNSQENEDSSSSRNSKCNSRPVKASSTTIRSPISDGSRNSADRTNESSVMPVPSNGGCKNITRPSSEKKQSTKINSFREEKVIKIEES